jgi:hypothetical protein
MVLFYSTGLGQWLSTTTMLGSAALFRTLVFRL